jgi:hypothetical protein
VIRRVLLALWLTAALTALSAQSGFFPRGDAAAAEGYLDWALTALDRGRWAEAGEALERARDYADVSSDLSYLLAVVRSHENRPQGAVLAAVRLALETNRWNRYSPSQARLLEAEVLIRLRAFSEALRSVSLVSETGTLGAEAFYLRLRALLGSRNLEEFRAVMALALERYPRDSRLLGLFLGYAADKLPEGQDQALMDIALRRLPLLLDEAPELAYLGAPFIRDIEEARRLVASYRAMGGSDPAAIPAALSLGLIDEGAAIDELFSLPGIPLDKALILKVWELLRHNPGREQFQRNLSRFSGVILEDMDQDGYFEARTLYRDGLIQGYDYDQDQDGLFEWRIFFSAGTPVRGEFALSPDGDGSSAEPGWAWGGPAFALPEGEGDRSRAVILWEQYPAVLRVNLGDLTYVFSPWEFSFSPLVFTDFAGGGPEGFWYPGRNSRGSRLTTRSLVSSAMALERPSREFSGAVERVSLTGGIPQRAAEYRDGRMVSVTEFQAGRPVIQRVDLDLDGRMETIRRFHRESRPPATGALLVERLPFEYGAVLESSESDWDGDGVYETGEEYFSHGGVARSWDMDKDGIREYTVINRENEHE